MESWCLMTVGFLSDSIQSLEISIADFRTMTYSILEIWFSR